MTIRFVVVDDDISIRKIVRKIIEDHALGSVVAECADGLSAEKTIQELRPDIAIVDLLLPGQDGAELVRKLRTQVATSFIMISESSNQPMITQAYQHGIEFYIHKPINVLELITVIKKVQESLELKKALSVIFKETARYAGPVDSTATSGGGEKPQSPVYQVFSDLGILGEAGIKHLYRMTQLMGGSGRSPDSNYQLIDKYQQMAAELGMDAKTIEQRVRRTIAKALHNLANIGLEDFHDDKFQTYGTALFEFSEVRQEMNFVQGKSPYHGKINVKKFIEGAVFLANTKFNPSR